MKFEGQYSAAAVTERDINTATTCDNSTETPNAERAAGDLEVRVSSGIGRGAVAYPSLVFEVGVTLP